MDGVGVTNETDLTQLVRRIMSGDSAAEDELVRRYQQGVAIIIDQIIRNRSVTEDVSQDTFRIVIAKVRRGDVRQPERLSGFVCSVARNAAVDYVRRIRQLRNHEATGSPDQITDPAPSPIEQMVKKENAALIRQLIGELKKKRDRDVLLRYYIGEEDKDKICADLGLTRAQFNNVISRATARLKELYQRRVARADAEREKK